MGDPTKDSSFRDIEYRVFYSPSDNPLQSFYLPTLSAAVHYDRSAGYFRSSALAAAAAGIVRLIANNGRMRLLVGAELSEADVEAIRHGYELRQKLAETMLGAFPDPDGGPLTKRLEALAWMVANGTLDIKVVLPLDAEGFPIPGNVAQDYYHAKKGIFTDAHGNQVGFTGSVNESAQGWLHNFEEFSVTTSWGSDYERSLLGNLRASFERMWEGKDRYWLAVDVPDAVTEHLIKFAPVRPPKHDALETALKDGKAGFGLATPKERLVFQFLRDAPYLPSARDLGEQTSGINPWPHQSRVARKVIARFPDDVMFCDEVGLGKTIEAGLVIRQLVLSGRVQRCLILAPASVTRQWQEELYEKFNLDIPMYERGQILNVRKEIIAVTKRPWDECDLLIASSHLARRRDRVKEMMAAQPWDLLVIDEAHHARRRDFLQPQYRPNRLLTLLNELKQQDQFLSILLMTATPMQVHPVEVWDLLTVLGLSGRWGADERNFLEFFSQLRLPYNDVQWDFVYDMVADYLLPDGQLDPFFMQEMQTRLGPAVASAIRELPQQSKDRARTVLHMPEAARPFVFEMARRHTPIKQYVFRNTRDLLRRYVQQGLLNEKVPTRRPKIERIQFRHEEETLYLRITEYITHFYQKYEAERRGLGFIMTVYRRRLTSSFYAARRSLERRRAWLEGLLASSEALVEAEGLEEDEDVLEELEQAGFELPELEQLTDAQKVDFQMEMDYLDDFITELRELSQADSKLTHLKEQLEILFKRRDTVLVFTQYTDTMDYLREHLCTVYGSSVACYSGRGGEQWNGIAWVPTSKEIVKNEFRKGNIKILLGTESASEGLNLQTCGVLINYDMPWNPMRVEQRIGRIDRIGQTYDEVWIYNYFYRDTIEDRIYQALTDRINWFETVVGDLQPILAEVGEATRKLAMLPADAQKIAFDEQIRALRKQIDDARTAAFKLDENVMVDDPEPGISTPVTLFDLESALINSQATGHLFKPHFNIPDAYHLTWDGVEADVTFSKERFDEYPNTLQFLSYGNPLLDAILGSVSEPERYPPGISRFTTDEFVPLRGWYRAGTEQVEEVTRLVMLRESMNHDLVMGGQQVDSTVAQVAFDEAVRSVHEAYTGRLDKRKQRRIKTLKARARRLLLQAAMAEIALGRQQDLFSKESYPTSFTETAITGLSRHGKVWNWMLYVGHEPGLRPEEGDPYFAKLAGQTAEKLRSLFGSFTKEAKDVVREWLRISKTH